MKKVDLFLGQDRETLTRDQMKAVTGGFADGNIGCGYAVYDGYGDVIYDSGLGNCGSTSMSACNTYAAREANSMMGQLGGASSAYICGYTN